MFKDARVGDKVWSPRWGDGEIVEIDYIHNGLYVLSVRFDLQHEYHNFTLEGKWDTSDKFPLLFWAGTKIIPADRPKRKVKKTRNKYVNIYPVGEVLYNAAKDAKDFVWPGALAIAVPVTIEFGMEE